MNSFNESSFLFLILIGVFASANDIDLANNTTILLLLAMILFSGDSNSCNNSCCGCRGNNIFF